MIGTVNVLIILLFTWAAAFAVALLIVLGLNTWVAVWYFQSLKLTGRMTGKAAAAWIISIAGWWTGPLFPICAIVGIVLACSQLSSSHVQATRIAAGLAIFNGVFITVWIAGVVLIVLAFR